MTELKTITTIRESRPGLPRTGLLAELTGKTIHAVLGWKIEGDIPDIPKFVGVFAFHTSNWDFIIMLATAFALRIRPNFIAKESLFVAPIGWLMRALGGIPVDRSKRTKMVELTAEQIRNRAQIVLGVAPEGTRSKSDYWKSGFYHIARLGDAPIILTAADYASKTVFISEPFMPSGHLDADLKIIQAFYAGITAKFPEEIGEIKFRDVD